MSGATPALPASQLELLGLRRFAPLFVTQFLGAFNDNVYKQALIILITFRFASEPGSGSAMLVTMAAGIFILPFFAFSALAGQIADKYEKAMLIRRVKIAEIVIMLAGAHAFLWGDVTWLMLVLFAMGTQSAMFGPLKYGILPQHLDERELTGGNGLIQMATYVSILVGTITGGFLVALDPERPYLVAVTVIVLAWLGWLASRAIPEAGAADPGLRIDWNIARQTVRGMRDARERADVFAAVVGISWFWFVGATFLQLLPTFARDVLGGDPHVVTLLLAAFSVGIGVGSLACERVSRGRIEHGLVPLGALGMAAFAIAPLLLALVHPETAPPSGSRGLAALLADPGTWPLLVCFLALSIFGGLYIVPLYALMQSRSPPAHRARVVAANNILNALFMVLSALMTMALLAAGVPIVGIFAVVGVLTALVLLWLTRRVPEFAERFNARFRGG